MIGPESPLASLAETVTSTGVSVYQPDEHGAPLHWTVSVGGVWSIVIVTAAVGVLAFPALS